MKEEDRQGNERKEKDKEERKTQENDVKHHKVMLCPPATSCANDEHVEQNSNDSLQ